MKYAKKYTIYILLIFIIASLMTGCNVSKKSNKYEMWHLNSLHIDKLWSYSKGESQTIAIIDSGISNELSTKYKDNIILKHNIIDETDNVTDNNGHGTEMASLIVGNGYMNIYGVAPEVKLIIIKVVDEEGATSYSSLNKALEYAIEHGATVINISLGGTKSDPEIKENIAKAIENEITVVAAAGDYEEKDILFPSNIIGVISVEAINKDNILWQYSNHSPNSVIAFPGEEIKAITYKNNENIVENTNGTSQAAAIASGYIALIKDYANNQEIKLNNEQIISILCTLDTKSQKDIDYESAFQEISKYK